MQTAVPPMLSTHDDFDNSSVLLYSFDHGDAEHVLYDDDDSDGDLASGDGGPASDDADADGDDAGGAAAEGADADDDAGGAAVPAARPVIGLGGIRDARKYRDFRVALQAVAAFRGTVPTAGVLYPHLSVAQQAAHNASAAALAAHRVKNPRIKGVHLESYFAPGAAKVAANPARPEGWLAPGVAAVLLDACTKLQSVQFGSIEYEAAFTNFVDLLLLACPPAYSRNDLCRMMDGCLPSHLPRFAFWYLQVAYLRLSSVLDAKAAYAAHGMPAPGVPAGAFLLHEAHVVAQAARATLLHARGDDLSSSMPLIRIGAADSAGSTQGQRWHKQLDVDPVRGAVVAGKGADSTIFKLWTEVGAVTNAEVRLGGVGPGGTGLGFAMEFLVGSILNASPQTAANLSAVGPGTVRYFRGSRPTPGLSGEEQDARDALAAAGGTAAAASNPADAAFLGTANVRWHILGMSLSRACARAAELSPGTRSNYENKARKDAGLPPVNLTGRPLSILAALYILVGRRLFPIEHDLSYLHRTCVAATSSQLLAKTSAMERLLRAAGLPQQFKATRFFARPNVATAAAAHCSWVGGTTATAHAIQPPPITWTLPSGTLASGKLVLLNYPPPHSSSNIALNACGLPVATLAFIAAAALAASRSESGPPVGPLLPAQEIPALHENREGDGALLVMFRDGPFTADLHFANDGKGVKSACGEPPSDAVKTAAEEAVKCQLFAQHVSQALRYVLVRGDEAREVVEPWLKNGVVHDGVKVTSCNASSITNPLI